MGVGLPLRTIRFSCHGGYGDRRTACNLLSLDDREAGLVAEVSLVLPREIDLAKDTVIGMDKGLHVFLGDDWYVPSIDSLDSVVV